MRVRNLALGVLFALTASGVVAPGAYADDPVYPSQQQVNDAFAAYNRQASTVSELEVNLTQLNIIRDEATIAAMVAQEDYLVALEDLDAAKEEEVRTATQAEEADAKREDSRQRLAAVALQAYRNGSGGVADYLNAVISADGPAKIVSDNALYAQLNQSTTALVQEFK